MVGVFDQVLFCKSLFSLGVSVFVHTLGQTMAIAMSIPFSLEVVHRFFELVKRRCTGLFN